MAYKVAVARQVSFDDLSPKTQKELDEFRKYIKSKIEDGTGRIFLEGELYFEYEKGWFSSVSGMLVGFLFARGCSSEEVKTASDFAWSKSMWVKETPMQMD